MFQPPGLIAELCRGHQVVLACSFRVRTPQLSVTSLLPAALLPFLTPYAGVCGKYMSRNLLLVSGNAAARLTVV
jgi:hypothetical protein